MHRAPAGAELEEMARWRGVETAAQRTTGGRTGCRTKKPGNDAHGAMQTPGRSASRDAPCDHIETGEQHAAGAKRVASPGLPPAVQVGRPPRLIGWPARARPLKASASPPPSGSCHPNSSSLLSASPSNIPPIKIAASFSSSSHFISLARHRRVAWRRVVSDLVLFFPLVFLFFAAFLLFLSTTPPPAFPLSRRLALVSLWVRELFESRFSAINSATRIYPAVVAAHDPYFLSSIVSS